MGIYNINGNIISQAFSKKGEEPDRFYDVNGNIVLNRGYYEQKFFEFAQDYIDDHGLTINGVTKSKEEVIYYLLNRDNCLFRGKLKKSGKYLIGEDGKIAELRGIGTHHLTQYKNLHTYEALNTLKYCGVNCVRMSAYLKDHMFSYSDNKFAPGYLTAPDQIKAEMDRIIGYCVELGLYVIADWHVWSGGGETLSTQDAVGFFTYFADKYKNCKNVLYELANEPFSDSLSDIVSHCSTLRTLIKSYVVDPVLICGTKSFGGGADTLYNALVAENIEDIFVSPHRYTLDASTVSSLINWYNNGIPLFVTEWSNTSSSTGPQSEMSVEAGEAYLAFFHEYGVPNCIWKFTDQTMAYSTQIYKDGTINNRYYKRGNYKLEDYSIYGKFMFDNMSSFAFENHIDR